MHTHPRFWHMPFPRNCGASGPKIIQKDSIIVIAEGGFRHKLLILLYIICAGIITFFVPMKFLAVGYRYIAMKLFGLAFIGIGFLHFHKSIEKTKFINDVHKIEQARLIIRNVTKPIYFKQISAFQVFPEHIQVQQKNDKKNVVTTIYHCYLVFNEQNNHVKQIGLFMNKEAKKHAQECLAIAKFCRKPIWEVLNNSPSLFDEYTKNEIKNIQIQKINLSTDLKKLH